MVPLVAPGSLGALRKKTVEARLDDVEEDIRIRRINDNMVFTRI